MSKTLTWPPAPRPGGELLRQTARVLRRASRALDRWARAPDRAAAADPALPVLEFHAEAGAPEGALYVDGQFVGTLHGVTRL